MIGAGTFRIGVFGYSDWGPNLVRNFGETKGCVVRAICDPDRDCLRVASCRYPGVGVTPHHEEELDDSAVDSIDQHLLFAAWNMGHLPSCRNGLLLRSPSEARPLRYSEDPDLTFELSPSADGLVVRAGTPDRHHYGVFRRT